MWQPLAVRLAEVPVRHAVAPIGHFIVPFLPWDELRHEGIRGTGCPPTGPVTRVIQRDFRLLCI